MPHTTKHRSLILEIAVIALSMPVGLDADDKFEALEVISHVIQDNREHFDSFYCEFQVTRGWADSNTEAWSERLRVRSVQDGILVASKGDMRYELKCVFGGLTKEELYTQRAANPESPTTSIACSSRQQLYSKNLAMKVAVSPLLEVVNLEANRPLEAVESPFSMGVMGEGEKNSPLQYILSAKNGQRHCQHLGTELMDGTSVDVIECAKSVSAQTQSKSLWYVDLARGGIPLCCRKFNADGSLVSETKAIQVVQVDNGGFICAKSISVFAGAKGQFDVTVIKLGDHRLDQPTREMLAVDLHPGMQVVNVKDLRSYIRLDRPERLYIDELPLWIERCNNSLAEEVARQERLGVGFESSAAPSGMVWWWPPIIGASLVVLIVAVFVFRYVAR